MNSLHPALVKHFLNQIPGATSILGIEQGEPGTFVLVVEIDGKKERLDVPKSELSTRLKTTHLSVRAKAGATFTEVLQRLSDDHGLYWVQGVDYTAIDAPAKGTLLVDVPASSFMWQGSVTLTIFSDEDRCKDPIRIPLESARTALMLSQKIFKPDNNIATPKGNLTQKVAEMIVAYLQERNDKTYGLKELAGSKVLRVFADSFSSVAILEVKGKGNVFIRFDSEKDNVVPPTNR
jgi:hypothetical protein